MAFLSDCEKDKRGGRGDEWGYIEAKWEKEENEEEKRKLKSFRYFSD